MSSRSTKPRPSLDRRDARGPRALPLLLILIAGLVAVLAAGSLWAAGCGSDEGETTSSQTTTASTSLTSTTSTSSPVTETIYPTDSIYPTSSTDVVKVDKLTLVAPPGPMAIPMAYLSVNDKLASVANETELVIWENADQLRAMVGGGQGDFVTMPSNNAAIFYNRGVPLQLLDISVWNITYLVTSDTEANSLSDIKGQSLVVSLQGSVPDVMFQFMAAKQGLDPQADFDLRYVSDPIQAAQLLMAGEVDNAVLSEAQATAVVLQTNDKEKPLRKAFAFDKAWSESADWQPGADLTPIAGTVATQSVADKQYIIEAFEKEYAAAVEWMLANPEEAGKLVETELPQLGLKAPVMTQSLKSITWKHTPAVEARKGLESFYTALMEVSPEVIGGKLPDDGFYYAP